MNLDPLVVAILRRLMIEHNIFDLQDVFDNEAEECGDISDLVCLQDEQ